MALNQANNFHDQSGNNGCWRYHGYAAFAASDATVEVPVPFKKLESFVVTLVGSPGATELPSVDETFVNGVATVDGSVTVKRAATTTSGLGFLFTAIGR
jgi:hypothetical protein